MLKYKVDGSNANNIYMTTQFASKDRLCVCMCVYTCVCVCVCVCLYIYGRVCACMCVEQCWVSSSITVQLIFWH